MHRGVPVTCLRAVGRTPLTCLFLACLVRHISLRRQRVGLSRPPFQTAYVPLSDLLRRLSARRGLLLFFEETRLLRLFCLFWISRFSSFFPFSVFIHRLQRRPVIAVRAWPHAQSARREYFEIRTCPILDRSVDLTGVICNRSSLN